MNKAELSPKPVNHHQSHLGSEIPSDPRVTSGEFGSNRITAGKIMKICGAEPNIENVKCQTPHEIQERASSISPTEIGEFPTSRPYGMLLQPRGSEPRVLYQARGALAVQPSPEISTAWSLSSFVINS